VEEFKYLGSILSLSGYSEKDIRVTIGMAKSAFNKPKNTHRRIKCEAKKRLVKTLVWSVALYGSETWTIKKAETTRLEPFEMWVWRRLVKVKWTDK